MALGIGEVSDAGDVVVVELQAAIQEAFYAVFDVGRQCAEEAAEDAVVLEIFEGLGDHEDGAAELSQSRPTTVFQVTYESSSDTLNPIPSGPNSALRRA